MTPIKCWGVRPAPQDSKGNTRNNYYITKSVRSFRDNVANSILKHFSKANPTIFKMLTKKLTVIRKPKKIWIRGCFLFKNNITGDNDKLQRALFDCLHRDVSLIEDDRQIVDPNLPSYDHQEQTGVVFTFGIVNEHFEFCDIDGHPHKLKNFSFFKPLSMNDLHMALNLKNLHKAPSVNKLSRKNHERNRI